jgi:tRNA (guanosine-2'-O-)-methyltransferase
MRRDAPELFEPERAVVSLPDTPERICEALEPLLSDERKQRIRAVIAARSRAVVPVLEGLIDPHNVAAVLRSSEAFGVQELHMVEGAEPFLASRRIAQGTERWVEVIRHASSEACVRALHARDYRVYVAAMDGDIQPEQLADEPRVAVVFGNEHAGVSDSMRQLCHGTYTIPMRGFVQSLNVSVAAALTLCAAMRGRPGDLGPEERSEMYARYCMLSVPRSHEILAEHARRSARAADHDEPQHRPRENA